MHTHIHLKEILLSLCHKIITEDLTKLHVMYVADLRII